MDYTKEENFIFARKFLQEGDEKNSLLHYVMLNDKDPDNAEAEFFSAYYAYKMFIDKREYPTVEKTVRAMTASVEAAVKWVKEREGVEDEQVLVVSKIVEYYTPIIRFLIDNQISASSDTLKGGILGLYALGNAIENEFGSESLAMKNAIVAWKEAVELQNKYWYIDYKGIKLEDYTNKIKMVDPVYETPRASIAKKIFDMVKGLFKK